MFYNKRQQEIMNCLKTKMTTSRTKFCVHQTATVQMYSKSKEKWFILTLHCLKKSNYHRQFNEMIITTYFSQ